MILEKYLKQTEFDSYEEFKARFEILIPENFNFAYDVVDEIAAETPGKTAMVWCDDNGSEAIFTFGQMKYYSDKAANFFKSTGIRKGDAVMLILKRHYTFWLSGSAVMTYDYDKFVPGNLMEVIEKYKVTTLAYARAMMQAVLTLEKRAIQKQS